MASSQDTSSSSSTSAHQHYTPARKAGHLYQKTGALTRKWKPRFFSLEGSLLYYFKREGDTVPKGIIVLTGCQIKVTRDKKYYSFRISHPKTSKTFDLAATLQSRMEDWVNALRDGAQAVHSQGPNSRSESSVDLRASQLEPRTPSHSSSFVISDSDLEAIAADNAELPEEYREEMEALMCEFMMQARDDAEGWKLQSEQRDCKVFVRAASRLGSCKGVGYVNYHPHLIMKLLLDLARRQSYDPQLLASRRAHVYNDHTFIDHLIYKPVFPAAGRDFVHVTHWRVLKDGSILIIATSVHRPDLCPSREPEIVRARTIMGGFLITPNNDYTGADVRYIIKADIRGGIPQALQTKLFTKQAFVIDGLRLALDEEEAEASPLPRVTNTTLFGLMTTEMEEDSEEMSTSRSFDESTEHDFAEDDSTDGGEFGTAAVPEKYRDLIEKAIARMNVEIADDSAWSFHSEKHGVKAYTKIDGSLTAAKGEGHIPFHPRAIWDVVMDVAKKKTYDPQLAHGSRVAKLDEQTNIDYLEYKPVLFVAGRDFVNLVHWRVLRDGTIVIVAQSIEELELCPSKEPKVVRAEVHIAGWKIVPDADYKGAHVTFMVKSDLKGSIPSRVASKVASEQPYMIHEVAQVLKKSSNLEQIVKEGKLLNSIVKTAVRSRSLSSQKRSRSISSSKTAIQPSVKVPEEGFPAIPAKYHDLIEKAIQRMNRDMDDEGAWNFHSEKYGIKAFTKIDGSLTSAKGVGHVPYNPRAIWDVVMDVERKKTYDSQLATGKRIATLDAQTGVDYLEYKPVFVVAGRDFVNLVHWRVLSGGTIIVVAQSIEDLQLCPSKEPKVVRGEVHIAGWKIVPDADYKGAQVTFMVKSDLKGSIPSRVASGEASKQPYMIHEISKVLKKSNLEAFTKQGKLTNTIFDASAVPSAPTRPVTVSHATPSKTLSSKSTASVEPEPEASVAPAKKDLLAGHKDVMEVPKETHRSTEFLATQAVQFIGGLLVLKAMSLPGLLHTGVVGFLVVWLAVMIFMGPSHMSPRRKLMIATYGPPDSGVILGTLSLDMTKTKKYIEEKRKLSGEHITITHIVLRALGAALANAPSVNGHIVFGNYYPAPSVDVSCLVAIGGGKDLGVCRLPSVDKMSLKDVCHRLRGDATKLRSGKDKEQEDRNKLMQFLPTYVIRPILNLVGWLGGCLGLRIKAVGVEPYMFGSCLVTSVGMMGLELAFAPLSAYTQTPMLITVGAIKDAPVVDDGKIVIRPMLTLTTTIDHRYVDGSQAARMGQTLKKLIEDPEQMEAVNV
ncbi:hypothetical protein ATCC90586_001406 [Pythium insidiosum]|nr:hypothetical protein ATCC90586_001406 [Pythium insidiosum]